MGAPPLSGWYLRQKPVGGSKAGGLPHPSLSPFPRLPLSIPPTSFPYQWEGRSDPVRGKFPGFPPTSTPLPIVKRFSAENFPSPVKSVPKMAVFRESGGLYVKFLFSNPKKAHPCAKLRRSTFLRENRFRGLGCRPLEEPGKKKPSNHLLCAISRIRGKETP